jgi:transcriptional regulator GlxA family with amidase domain
MRGRGRPALHLDARKLQQARELYEKKEMSVAEIMALTGFASRYSFYKYVVHKGSDALSTDKKGKRPKKTERRENEGREKK